MLIRIADRVAHAMLEEEIEIVMWGDGLLGNAAGDYIKGKMSTHPLDRMIAVCNACERAPDLFEKVHIRGHDSNGRSRLVRGFKLIGTPRPLDQRLL